MKIKCNFSKTNRYKDMKLTGKYLAEHNSSFVEFEVDALPTMDEQEKIKDKQSCYEAIWLGNSSFIEGGFSLMICFDESNESDIELIKKYLDEDSQEIIDDIRENF